MVLISSTTAGSFRLSCTADVCLGMIRIFQSDYIIVSDAMAQRFVVFDLRRYWVLTTVAYISPGSMGSGDCVAALERWRRRLDVAVVCVTTLKRSEGRLYPWFQFG